MSNIYDLIIIGGGPAGMSAGLYASRGKLKTIILEKRKETGGQAYATHEIENYPGTGKTNGPELMKKFRKHAEEFGVEIKYDEIKEIKADNFSIILNTKSNQTYKTKTAVIATGAKPRTLGLGENKFRGRGVSYCSTCDADFYVDLEVIVVGNGNAAVEEAIYLTKFASRVTIVVIHDKGIMDADKIIQEKAYKNEKIEFVWNSILTAIRGKELVEGVVIKNMKTGELSEMQTDGVFIFVGTIPQTDFLEGLVELTDQKYVRTNDKMETNVPGIYAAGDVRDKYLRQIITAASDGAVAAVAAESYIEQVEYWQQNVLRREERILIAFWSPINKESVDAIIILEGLDLTTKNIKLLKLDTYKNKLISERYNVKETPSLLLFEDGEMKERVVKPKVEELKSFINNINNKKSKTVAITNPTH